MKNNKPFLIISVLSIIFLSIIAINLSPLLFGPAPYPPDWRWTYLFSNTLSRIWFPILIIGGILFLANYTEKRSELENKKKLKWIILSLIFLGFLFQISILFYSRAGLTVLVARIINPDLSGYFTSSLTIDSLGEFIKNYNQNVANYPMYGRFHPPGAILFFWIISSVLHPFSPYFSFINHLNPNHSDILLFWKDLAEYQKVSAIFSGFFIAFIANLSIIPLFLCAKILYGVRVAIRSMFLFMFVPCIILFTPLNDVFMPLFTLFSLYYFLKGIKSSEYKDFFISGLILFIGLFFNLTFLPILLLFFILYLLHLLKNKSKIFSAFNLKISGIFIFGFIISPVILFIFGLNSIETTRKIMEFHIIAQTGREYGTWFFYNMYDFLLFAGIPISLLFIYLILRLIRSIWKNEIDSIYKFDHLFLAFVFMLLAIEITGTVRAETARIWIPFVPILVLIVSNFITNVHKLKTKQFLLLLILLAVQILVFQTVLVTVW